MRVIKNIFFLAIIAGSAYGSYYLLNKGPCDAPIAYRIGAFDARFGVSKADFILDTEKAEKIWEAVAGRPLLKYDPQGGMPINLIYDSRQATADANKTLINQVDATESSTDSLKRQIASLRSEYDAAQSEYKSLVASFEAKLAAYNSTVAYWNARGGAPAGRYDSLQNQKADLEALQEQANAKMVSVNDLARQVNDLIDRYNSLASSANAVVSKINQSADKEFEQGEYVSDASGQRIDVYEFDGTAKLVRLLSHEMGHALGMGHNSDPSSIMYYLNKGTSLSPSAEDISALRTACRLR